MHTSRKSVKTHGILLTTYDKKKPNGKITKVKTSAVTQYQLRHLFASLGVLIKAEPKALQILMGHGKIATTMDVYAEAPTELQQETAETIDEFISYLSLEGNNEDATTLFQNIQALNLDSLERNKANILTQELTRMVNIIPKLEEQSKDLILNLSNIGSYMQGASAEFINHDNRARLELIYSISTNLDAFKIQTRNIRRSTKNCNKDYNYTFNYIKTTQNLLNTMNMAMTYKSNQQLEPIRNAASY